MAARRADRCVTHEISERGLGRRGGSGGGRARAIGDHGSGVGRCRFGKPAGVVVDELGGSYLRIDGDFRRRVREIELGAGFDGDSLRGLRQLAGAVRWHLHELVAFEILESESPEHVVDDRIRHLDVGVSLDKTTRFERLECERIDVLLERHAVLEALRNGDGEAAQHTTKGRALFRQVDEELTQGAVVVLAGAEEHLVSPNAGLLREPDTP